MEENEFYKVLVQRYLDKQLSDEELELFVQLTKEGKLDDQLLEAWNEDMEISEDDEMDYQRVNRPKPLWPKIAAAASILMAIFAGLYFYSGTGNTLNPLASVEIRRWHSN
jgi:transmembrane sensor